MSNNVNGFCNFSFKICCEKVFVKRDCYNNGNSKGVIMMTDNSSNFNPIKSAGIIVLAVLLAASSVLSVAAAAVATPEKETSESNAANSAVYETLDEYGVKVSHNGVVTKLKVTGGTVADAIKQAGLTLNNNQITVPTEKKKKKKDTDILIYDAKKISITADGKTQDVLVPYGKVGESLPLAGVRLSQEDVLSVKRDAMVQDISELTIKRVTYKNVNVTEAVPFESKKENSEDVELGESKLKTKGVDGEKLVTKKVKYIDGKKDSEKVVSEKVTKAPVDEVTLVGTSGAANADGAGSFTDENGVKVNYSYKLTGSGTAYTAPAGALTATGAEVYEGGVAVNPALIPYGSKLYIETTDGSFSYGYATAVDTGGALMDGSAIVDLFYFSLDDCYSFGRRDVNVYVIE